MVDDKQKLAERKKLQDEINEGLRSQNNLTSRYAELLNVQLDKSKDITDDIKDRVGTLNVLVASTDKSKTLEERITSLKSLSADLEDEINARKTKSGKLDKRRNLALTRSKIFQKSIIDLQLKALEVQGKYKDKLKDIDKAFGGIGEKIVGFMTNPLTAAVALIATFDAQQKQIAKQFGGIGVKDFREELAGASQEFVGLTLSGEEAQKAISDLANNFGMSIPAARELSNTVGRIAISTGMSVDETTKLVGLFTQTQGLTGQQAEDLLLGTRQLAKANNVAPDKVLSDIAADTELFARFTKDGGENLLRAAVQARKLGINISAVAKAADSLLDFQSSLNAEIEASIILGRDVNLQKARELSLNNDIEGLQKEIVKQVGTEAEFNKLNRFQRDSLAKAVNMSVSDIQKLVSRQKEQITLQGEINRLTAENEVPGDTITAVAKILADLKQTGMELAERIGPGLISVVEVLGGALSFLDRFIGLGNLAIGIMSALIVKNIAAAGAAAALAYFKTAGSMGPGGLAMLAAAPIAIPLLVGIAATAISGIASAQDGALTTQDGLMQVHKQEAILPIEMLGEFIEDAMKPMVEATNKAMRSNERALTEVGNKVDLQAGRFADAVEGMS